MKTKTIDLPPTVSTLKTLLSTAILSKAIKMVSNKMNTWVGSRAELHAVNPTRSASYTHTRAHTHAYENNCEWSEMI